MQGQKEAPPDFQCKDKFLLQSVVAPDGATTKDIVAEMFTKEAGKVVEEFKFRVVYVPANPPSPVPEGSDEGSSPRVSPHGNGNQNGSSFDDVSRSLEAPKEKSSEELMRREVSKSRAGGFSILFVLLVGLLGVLGGYLVKRS